MSRTTTTSELTDDTTTDPDRSGDGDPSTSTGRWRWAALLAVAAAAVAAAAVLATSAGGEETSEDPVTPVLATATVQRRDIVSTTTVDGTLTYTDSRAVTADAAGTVTGLPEVGATVQPGEALYAVDGVAVVLLPGELPLWRELSTDSDPGQDVTVLEQALVDLGHADPELVTVDDTFTDATADAVAAFREAVGLADGDSLDPAEVAVLPDAVRIAGHEVQLGDGLQPGAAVLTVTGTERVATGVLAVPVEAVLALAEGGYALEVIGPDGTTSMVAVTLGDFADGWVEVAGDQITEGTEVVSA